MKLKSVLFAAAVAVSSLSVQAASYSFSQGGFDGGASVSGSFSGADLDLNGFLDFNSSIKSTFSTS